MASITGMKTGSFTDINLQGSLRVGDTLNPGVVGQVLISNGEGQATEWGTNSAVVPNALTAGSNVSFSSGNASWDGAIADTINATDTDTTYQGSATINIDTTTNPDTINCIKVPNALTAGTNVSFSVGTTYDGSSAITINTTDTNTTYQAGNGIEIDTTTNPDTIKAKPDEDTIDFDGSELAVLKVPNGLSAGTNLSYTSGSTFDGATARTINLSSAPTNLNLTDNSNIFHPANVFDYAGDLRMSIEMGNFYPNDDSSYFNIGVEDDLSAKIHGTIRVLTSSLEVCGYFIIPRNYTATAVRIDVTNSSGSSVSRTITVESVTTYGSTGFSSLGTITTNSEQNLTTSMTGASDKIMLIKIYTTSTTDHIRGGYIKLTRDSDDY